MYSRGAMKKKAKRALKRHYLLFVAVCLIAGFLGSRYANTTGQVNVKVSESKEKNVVENGKTTVVTGFAYTLNGRSLRELKERLFERAEKWLADAGLDKTKVLGRSRGVLAAIVNMTSSGTILMTITSAAASLAAAGNPLLLFLIAAGFLAVLFVWFCLSNTYTAVAARIFMEGRVYEEVPAGRFLFFLRVKKWLNVSLVMLRATVYQVLWWMTFVGGFIKTYSYRMVPYITAENPSLSSKEAITLSRRMMNGHKWECFKLDLSFIGWHILNGITMGISGKLFSNPYRETVYCEYYAYLRALAKQSAIRGTEFLNDRYLFETASQEERTRVYGQEIKQLSELPRQDKKAGGILGFLADVFGVALVHNKQEQEYEAYIEKSAALRSLQSETSGKSYPTRLCPLKEEEKRKKLRNLCYERHYSVWSVIMLYFIFSFIGWVWEVSLHLIPDGEFVNRGVLHGPWLPIYGTGGVLILILLNKFRKKPMLQFMLTVVLCGCVEYYTAWYLETTHGGQKWWDYSGYFLNLHGRICAEGLLVFGLGGVAIVYLVAPLLDNLLRRISRKILIPLCAVLLVLYCADQRYSSVHPNTGKGITDYAYDMPAGRTPAGMREGRETL